MNSISSAGRAWLRRTLSVTRRRSISFAEGGVERPLAAVESEAAEALRRAEVPEPELSARHLVAAAASKGDAAAEADARLSRLLTCRLARMPVQYVVGDWDFRRLTLITRPPVFIPRPETEELVGLVLDQLRDGMSVLDVGCGSGAVALSLLEEGPAGLAVTAVDQSAAAVALTAENAAQLGLDDRLTLRRAKLMDDGAFDGDVGNRRPFDAVVSNPPYVLRKDLHALAPEIALYEDLRALDGGADGLRVITALLHLCHRDDVGLARGGRLFLETDPCHKYLIPQLLSDQPEFDCFRLVEFRTDFAGKDRFAVIEKAQ